MTLLQLIGANAGSAMRRQLSCVQVREELFSGGGGGGR
jgi:hypothetical protein